MKRPLMNNSSNTIWSRPADN